MVITVESVSIVQILSFSRQLDGKLYAGGAVKRLPGSDPIENQQLLHQILEYRDQFDPDFLNYCKHSPLITQYEVVQALNLPSEDKYRFILMTGKNQKEEFLAGQLRYLKMIRNQEALLGDDFGLN